MTNQGEWKRHRGGKCPVAAGVLIDVRRRNGEIERGIPALEIGMATTDDGISSFWRHDGDSAEIMAYRIHTPAIEPAAVANDEEISVGAIPAYKVPPARERDPLAWRDRIRAIDAEAKAEAERHAEAMSAYDKERAELVEKLKAEGLALHQDTFYVRTEWMK